MVQLSIMLYLGLPGSKMQCVLISPTCVSPHHGGDIRHGKYSGTQAAGLSRTAQESSEGGADRCAHTGHEASLVLSGFRLAACSDYSSTDTCHVPRAFNRATAPIRHPPHARAVLYCCVLPHMALG